MLGFFVFGTLTAVLVAELYMMINTEEEHECECNCGCCHHEDEEE